MVLENIFYVLFNLDLKNGWFYFFLGMDLNGCMQVYILFVWYNYYSNCYYFCVVLVNQIMYLLFVESLDDMDILLNVVYFVMLIIYWVSLMVLEIG